MSKTALSKAICTFAIISFAILSCKNQEPTDLPFDRDVLIDVMADLEIAKAAIIKYHTAERDSIRELYRYQISKIHNIDLQLMDSMIYVVQSYPKALEEINDSVVGRLERLEKTLDQID